MKWLNDPQAWLGLLTLTALEIVLGIDNIIFISILSGKLPREQQPKARQTGLLAAMGMRIALLSVASWIIHLEDELFAVFGYGFSGKSLILLAGGLFLLGKSVHEIHARLEGEEGHATARVAPSFGSVIFQIMLLDIVFSIDSVITAVGMVDQLAVMIAAVVVSVAVMMAFAGPIAAFVEKHPTIKMLALSFLVLIGTMLIAEAFHAAVPKGYIYFAIGFSVFVEMLNIRVRSVSQPVHLHQGYTMEE